MNDETLRLADTERDRLKHVYRDREQAVLIDALEHFKSAGDGRLSFTCRAIAENRGFRDATVTHDDAFRWRGLCHIAGEIEEFQDAIGTKESATMELADMVILVMDLFGPDRDYWLDDIDYDCNLGTDKLSKVLHLAMQAAYKHGFSSGEFQLAMNIFLNTTAVYGAFYADGMDKFRLAIVNKCLINIRREVKYGVNT